MIDPAGLTLGAAFDAAASRYGDARFFEAPPDAARAWNPEGRVLTFAEAAAEVAALRGRLRAAGYGRGQRVALDLENRPEHVVWKLALAGLGMSAVPINPDLRPAEAAYILGDCAPILAVAAPNRRAALEEAIALGAAIRSAGRRPTTCRPHPPLRRPAIRRLPTRRA